MTEFECCVSVDLLASSQGIQIGDWIRLSFNIGGEILVKVVAADLSDHKSPYPVISIHPRLKNRIISAHSNAPLAAVVGVLDSTTLGLSTSTKRQILSEPLSVPPAIGYMPSLVTASSVVIDPIAQVRRSSLTYPHHTPDLPLSVMICFLQTILHIIIRYPHACSLSILPLSSYR